MRVLDLGRVVGMSAYELAVSKGYEGTLESWLESLRYDHSDEYKQFTETIEAAKQDILSGKEEIKLSMTQIRDLVEKSLTDIKKSQKDGVDAVDAASTSAISSIESMKDTVLADISSAESAALTSLADALTSAVTGLNTAGSRWEQQIKDTGTLAQTAYNQNADEKTTEFDTHVSEKQDALDNHIKEKQDAFDSNATEKQTAFDENANQKTQEFDNHTEQIQNDLGQLKEDLGNIIYKGLINGFDKDNTVSGFLYNDGTVHSDSRFVTSDYFDVHENKTYYALQMVYTVKYDNVSYICFYDSSKTFIAGGYFHASSCTSPNGSKYARVTFPSDEVSKARCMFTSIETPDKYYPFSYEYSVITKDVSELKTRKSENRLYGKTMAVLGDSMAKGHTLSENQTWAYKIASRNNMTYQKVAANGAFITTGHGDSADANCLLEQLKKITGNPDIIVIHMGTNDRSKNIKIGNWSSSNIDTTNIYGALRVAFKYILEHFTSSQVMFITPYFYGEQTDYIGAIENACMNIGTVHCKNNKQGGICVWNDTVKSMYFIDNVHLNELGQERATCEYEGFMRTFM